MILFRAMKNENLIVGYWCINRVREVMAKPDFYYHIELDDGLRKTLQLVAEGKTDQQIKAIFSTSLKTAKRHRNRLRRIFNADSTAEMITKACALGYVDMDAVFANDKIPLAP